MEFIDNMEDVSSNEQVLSSTVSPSKSLSIILPFDLDRDLRVKKERKELAILGDLDLALPLWLEDIVMVVEADVEAVVVEAI